MDGAEFGFARARNAIVDEHDRFDICEVVDGCDCQIAGERNIVDVDHRRGRARCRDIDEVIAVGHREVIGNGGETDVGKNRRFGDVIRTDQDVDCRCVRRQMRHANVGCEQGICDQKQAERE